jgi:hypothetical protein
MTALPTGRTVRDAYLLAAKSLAQDTPAQPLLAEPGDYTTAFTQALRQFDRDRPNARVVHYVVLASASQFTIWGTGAILSGADAWLENGSSLTNVWPNYVANAQQTPLDLDQYRLVRNPTAIVLELLDTSVTLGGTLRLEFVRPHQVDDSTVPATAVDSILASDADAFDLLLASIILLMAATRAVQNMGTSSLPNDIVDRRTQVDMWARRAKEYRALYDQAIGIASPDAASVAGAGLFVDLDASTSHPLGFLWRRS